MPDFNVWAGVQRIDPIDASRRAVDAWKRIQDKPVTITITRGSSTIAAQVVRIEFDETNPNDANTQTTQGVPTYDLILFGVQNHPSVTASNLQDGDRFRYDGKMYEVRDVIKLPGEVQARAVRYGK